MKKESLGRLEKSVKQTISYEECEWGARRVSVQKRPVKLRINIMLDEDIVEHFKSLAARPNAAPYQTQINQTLRDVIEKTSMESEAELEIEKIADLIATKVADQLRRSIKRKYV